MEQPLIFVVDDDRLFSNVIGMFLKQEGFDNITYHASAEQCLEELHQAPEFVFLDYNMEDMNGLEALRKIKSTRPEIKVFLVTSIEDESIKKECIKEGAELFLNKNEIFSGFPAKLIGILKH